MKNKHFSIVSWAMYDLANQFFALNVVSLYFPRWLIIDQKASEIYYSVSFGLSTLLVALFAPVLGTISDLAGLRKKFLIYFTLLSIVFTVLLGFCHTVFFALVCFIIANFGCQEAVVFYNALIVEVSPEHKIGLVSGIGRMFGYLGAMIALFLSKPVIVSFGYSVTFIITGILFFIFALPCMMFVKEITPKETIRARDIMKRQELFHIYKKLKLVISSNKELWSFLKTIFFCLCVVNTVILFMAIYATKVFGLSEVDAIHFIAFSTVFALLGSIVSGFISDFIGIKRALTGIFSLWGLCLLGGALLRAPFHWVIGALGGFSMGAVWVVTRAVIVKLVPRNMVAEAFGVFNLVSYVSGIIGPLYLGILLLFLSSLAESGYRIAFFSLMIFIAIGSVTLIRLRKRLEAPLAQMKSE